MRVCGWPIHISPWAIWNSRCGISKLSKRAAHTMWNICSPCRRPPRGEPANCPSGLQRMARVRPARTSSLPTVISSAAIGKPRFRKYPEAHALLAFAREQINEPEGALAVLNGGLAAFPDDRDLTDMRSQLL